MIVRPRRAVPALTMASLLAGVIGLQAVREQMPPRALSSGVTPNLLYVRSPAVMARAALSYRGLVADIYWIRALQHYGRTKRARSGEKTYDLLYPLLDLTTSLDPNFNIAYRFGSIFLTEQPPGGPGRVDLAVALLKKGLASHPDRWEYAQDIGFVYYRAGDYVSAADWFRRAFQIPGAPAWLEPLEAVTRTQGGDRQTARRLWSELAAAAGAEEEWTRMHAAKRLRQLDALDQIDTLDSLIAAYRSRAGMPPRSWADLIAAGLLPGVPLDPDRHPYQLNPYWATVTLDPASPLNPLPVDEQAH